VGLSTKYSKGYRFRGESIDVEANNQGESVVTIDGTIGSFLSPAFAEDPFTLYDTIRTPTRAMSSKGSTSSLIMTTSWKSCGILQFIRVCSVR
jgi:hypothetical protein